MTDKLNHVPAGFAIAIAVLGLNACGGGADSTANSIAATSTSSGKVSAFAVATDPAGARGTNPPIVFNATGSPRPGDVVSLQGENFGSNPVVLLDSDPSQPLAIVNRVGDGWLAVQIPASATGALQLRVRNETSTSALLKLNAARPLHLDALELVPGGAFRVFGRNLLLAGSVPHVVINGAEATLDLSRSNEHVLFATVPKTLVASRSAQITVDNGNGTGAAALDRTVTVLRSPGADPFDLKVSWAAAFSAVAGHQVDAAADPRLSTRARCDGAQDDVAAIQQAMDLAAADGGGIVQLPAGTCRLGNWLQLRSRVVLQGAGKAATELRYASNYPLYGVKLDLTGVRNLSLTNAGAASEGPLLKDSTHVVMQNVAVHLGSSRQMYLTGNRHFAVQGSDFIQSAGIGLQGPYTFDDTTGLSFEGNSTRWVDGAPTFGRVHDSVLATNRFMRDATVQDHPGFVHSMTLDFAHRVAVLNNTFDVIGGPVLNRTRNDGETILVEGGSTARTENLGSVASATATTLNDPSTTLQVDPFGSGSIPENYGLVIVAGKGAGQSRRVVSYKAPTVTVDRAWEVVPDASSRYATFVWGLEKSLIKDNVLSQNPRGIWLYGTSVREVDVVGNTVGEGGGIYLRSTQDLSAKRFTIIYNVGVAGNHIANSAGNWMSYINSVFVNIDAKAFGVATLGVEIRDNDLVTNRPNVTSSFEEYANIEGLMVMSRVETGAPYESSPVPRMLGTLVTGNSCAHCDTVLRLGTGAGGTTVLNTRLLDSAAMWADWATAGTNERSINTLINP